MQVQSTWQTLLKRIRTRRAFEHAQRSVRE
jgi:hypothetical protein